MIAGYDSSLATAYDSIEETEAVEQAETPSHLFRFLDGNPRVKWVLAAVLVVVAIASAGPLGSYFSSPEAYDHTIASLDEKRNVVTGLMTLSVASSAAISAIPDDTGTPIAERLAELSQDFLVILTVIYLEKFLLTTFGLAAFRILIPIACIVFLAATVMAGRYPLRNSLGHLSAKLALFGAAIVLLLPASILIADQMEQVHNVSLENSLQAIQQKADGIEEAAPTQEDSESNEGGLLQQFASGAYDAIAGLADKVASTVANKTDQALGVLGQLTDTLALMIVTSCVIPLLVAVLLLWVLKLLLGIDTSKAMQVLTPRAIRAGGLPYSR